MEGKSSWRFILGSVVSLSFSIAVILCTIGLMDGFEKSLKSGLERSSGHIQITQSEGFFFFNNEFKKTIEFNTQGKYTALLQSEGFVLTAAAAKGLLVKGIGPQSFADVTNLKIKVTKGQVILGRELFEALERPEAVQLVFGTGSKKNQGAPVVRTFKVAGVVSHGIYEKDLRFAYVDINELREILELKGNVINVISIKLPGNPEMDKISEYVNILRTEMPGYRIMPFWREFQILLDAVKVEKFSISLILQIIVVVAIFNLMAFIIFVSEKKSQDFFLLRALGLGAATLNRFWILTTVQMWVISCVLAIFLSKLFNEILVRATFIKIPGDIYVLNKLRLDLTWDDFVLVFGLSLAWVLLITVISLLRLQRVSLLKGLRQEFS